MKKFTLILLSVLIAVGFAFTGCNEDNGTVKIGAILPLTGKSADAGNAVKVGLEISIQELNAKSENHKYEAFYYDTESETKNASFGYRNLRQINKATIFFTTTSDHSLILKPLAEKDSVLLFCIAPHPDITENNNGFIFRPAPVGNDESEVIFEYIENNLNSQKIFVYCFNTDAGNTFKSLLENRLNNEIVGSCLFNEDPSAVKNITSLPSIGKAESIIIYGYSAMIGHIIKSLREKGFSGSIICNSGFNTPSVLSVAGDNAINTLYVDYSFPYKTEGHFKRDSIAKSDYKTSFSALSYMAYCPMYIIDKAINENCKSEKEIAQFLTKEKEYNINEAFFKTFSDGSIKPSFVIKKYSGN